MPGRHMSYCNHWMDPSKWREEQHNGRTRVMCRHCGAFVGYLKPEAKKNNEAMTGPVTRNWSTPMKFPPQSESTYQRPPAGNHAVRCYEILDLGTQETKFGNKRQISFAWELCNELMDDGRPFTIRSQRYNFSANKESSLRLMLESWRGRAFTDDELETFNLESVLGAPCLLNVVHKDSQNGKTYADVLSVTPLPRGTDVPPPVNPTVLIDLDNFDANAFSQVSEYWQAVVAESPEYQAAVGNGKPQSQPQATEKVPVTEDYRDDEVPF